ncbi:hypothetical protein T459_03735 [Capsicum annuum]|uniref:Pre-SET domain-containing protein n=1 Tax=Capsicum annuum TaxID=4072 RepID=A0A2G3ANX5_CAPAN|nr:glycosyl hydrolase family 38 family protein [Capsicum annuum]PHT95853.1 hypothetical protein T459_03735 [Capsicum annuum]
MRRIDDHVNEAVARRNIDESRWLAHQLIICPGLSDLSRIRGFTYTRGIIYAKGINLPSAPTGCNYCGSCLNPRICSCAKLNGSDFPYVHKYGGRRVQCCIRLLEILIEPKAGVFECGLNCGCGPAYVNRTFQKGLRYRLEVFRTPNKGWGVRLWDYIPYVATICEYIGLLKKTDQIDPAADKNYVFDIDCLQTMKGLDGREASILLFYRPNFHFLFSYVIYRDGWVRFLCWETDRRMLRRHLMEGQSIALMLSLLEIFRGFEAKDPECPQQFSSS